MATLDRFLVRAPGSPFGANLPTTLRSVRAADARSRRGARIVRGGQKKRSPPTTIGYRPRPFRLLPHKRFPSRTTNQVCAGARPCPEAGHTANTSATSPSTVTIPLLRLALIDPLDRTLASATPIGARRQTSIYARRIHAFIFHRPYVLDGRESVFPPARRRCSPLARAAIDHPRVPAHPATPAIDLPPAITECERRLHIPSSYRAPSALEDGVAVRRRTLIQRLRDIYSDDKPSRLQLVSAAGAGIDMCIAQLGRLPHERGSDLSGYVRAPSPVLRHLDLERHFA